MKERIKYSNDSKLALMVSILALVNIAFNSYFGMIVGFFLALISSYIAWFNVKPVEPKNKLVYVTLFFSVAALVLILMLFSKGYFG